MMLRGGIAIGGIAIVKKLTPDGIAIGGTSNLGLELPAVGGIALGGVGGINYFPPVAGGIAEGGTSAAELQFVAAGGIALGGVGSAVPSFVQAGGIALGGDTAAELQFVQAGGIALGGDTAVVVTSGVSTPCCANPVSTDLYVYLSNASSGVTCVNGVVIHCVYNSGMSRWTGSASGCSGTINFSVQCNTSPSTAWGFLGTGSASISAPLSGSPSGSCGPPFDILWTGCNVSVGVNLGTCDVRITDS